MAQRVELLARQIAAKQGRLSIRWPKAIETSAAPEAPADPTPPALVPPRPRRYAGGRGALTR